jgi:uncharacterized membrane protein YjjP (DUF1212 family)
MGTTGTGDIMEVCLLAGQIMLKYGGETYRVEETMGRMARAHHLEEVHSFVTPTGIFLSFTSPNQPGERTRVVRIGERLIDLSKVTMVNDLSRRFVKGHLTLAEAEQELRQIDRQKMNYPILIQHMASGLASGSFAILFGGAWVEFGLAFIAGAMVNISLIFIQSIIKVKFFSELLSAFIGGTLSIFLVYIVPGVLLDQVFIGSLMPLFPGLPLTNAVRDVMAGDLISGLGRGAEATLTALSIATGIALALTIFL